MASTYENDLRLQEIGTGEQSGTWGTTTNTNLELIGEALSYSATGEAIANASTHTITVADGVADEARCFYLKCTGGGQACTVTLAPNSLSKVWVIENTTSYTLTFSQGSGANVAILAGQVKMIATDGAGSGAAIYDLMQDLAVPDLFVDDDVSLQSDGAIINFGASAEIQLTHVADTGLLLTETGGGAPTLQFRDSAISISSSADATLDIASDGAINLTAGTDVVIPANIGLTFGTGEKIEGDSTDLTITSGAKINLTATSDVHIPNAVGLVFGDGGEHIETDNTNLTVTSGGNVIVAATTLDLNGTLDVSGTGLVTGVLTTTATQVATGGITSGSNIVSDTDSTDDLGTTSVRWANLFVDAITATDQITATGFTGTLDGILGSGTAAAATVTTLDSSGAVNLNLTTDSTSSTSGALIVDGGVGIAKKLFVGTDLDVDGTTNLDVVDIDGAVDMASTLGVTGVLTANAGVVVDNITIDGNDISTTNSNGALTITPNGTGDLQVNSDRIKVKAANDETASIMLASDNQDNAGDSWTVIANTDNTFAIQNDISGSSDVTHVSITPNATVANSTVDLIGHVNVGHDLDVAGNAVIDGTALVTGVLTTTAAAVFNGGFTSNGDDVVFSSANADDPLLTIKQTGNNASSARIYFVKDKGAAGADNDEIGKIQFIADNDAQQQTSFVKQIATIADASDGSEGGKFQIQVASHDGELVDGLVLTDGDAEDEIDVTIASGTSSVTSVAGDLSVISNVGIGDSSPTELLEIAGSSDPTLLIRHNTADNANSGKISFRESAGGSTGADLRYDGSANNFIIDTSDASNALVIKRTTGNVGIGGEPVATASAYDGATLHLRQEGSSKGSQIHLTNAATGDAAGNGVHISMWHDDDLYITNQESDGNIKFSSGGNSDALVIDDSGNTTFAGNAVIDGTALVTGVLTTTAATVFNGGFASAKASSVIAVDGAAANAFAMQIHNLEASANQSFGLYIRAGGGTAQALEIVDHDASNNLFRVTGTGQLTAPGGAVSAPTYSFVGDTDTGISRPTTNAVNIVTAGTERMRIDSIGNLGLGVAPDTLSSGYRGLQINGFAYNIGHSGGDHYITNNAYFNGAWKYGQTSTAQMVELSSGQIQFKTAASGSADADITWVRSMNILSGGGVVINDDSADMDFRVESNGNANMLFVDGGNDAVVVGANDADTTISGGTPAFQVIGTGVATGVAVTRRENNAFGAALYLSKSRNTTPDAFTVVQAGDSLGSVIFLGDDGTNLDTYGATITNVVKSGVGENDMPTELIFSTNSGTTTVAERMKIQFNSGNNVVIADGLTLTDGNVIIGGAGHGIDFSAQSANGGMTAELLDHYEEGTWTPTIASDAGAAAYTTQVGFYTRIGSIVHVSATLQISDLGSFAGAVINLSGFPFTISDATNYNPIGSLVLSGTATAKSDIFLRFTLDTILARLEQANGQVTHDNNMNANAFDTGTILKMSGSYIVK